MNRDSIYNRKLSWRHLKALHELFTKGVTKSKIRGHSYIEYLIRTKGLIKPKIGNLNILEAQRGFAAFYELNFKKHYDLFINFFNSYGIESDAKRKYLEEDIFTLLFISEHQESLRKELSTIRTFSATVFKGKGSKYLENNISLKNAVCQILSIEEFPEKDPKNLAWRFVVDSVTPSTIVLCENLAFLKLPWKAKENNIELWYVGGNNITIIDDIQPSKLSLPIYYSCDWDYHGLKIYSSIKEKLKVKGADLKLLSPPSDSLLLSVNSPNHNSEWNHSKPLSGLNPEDFNNQQLNLIKALIQKDQWIEEESNDLLELVCFNKITL
ncbi:hypothetical protein [Ekhidna sp.]|uniref:hypothetical protein n=1 Tax=Ekhidna sp. TaxID=2608089 RepID=UPI003297CD00